MSISSTDVVTQNYGGRKNDFAENCEVRIIRLCRGYGGQGEVNGRREPQGAQRQGVMEVWPSQKGISEPEKNERISESVNLGRGGMADGAVDRERGGRGEV